MRQEHRTFKAKYGNYSAFLFDVRCSSRKSKTIIGMLQVTRIPPERFFSWNAPRPLRDGSREEDGAKAYRDISSALSGAHHLF